MTWVKWIRLGNQSPVFPFFPLILDRRLAVLSHHLLQRLKPSGKYSPTVALIAGDCLENVLSIKRSIEKEVGVDLVYLVPVTCDIVSRKGKYFVYDCV